MVYKKYIERNGKLYGPYLYNSHRVDGKVISEYKGSGKKDYKKFIFLSVGILFLIFSIFFIINFRGKISGNVVSESDSNIQTEVIQEKTLIYPKIYFTLVSTKIQPEEITEDETEKIVEEEPIIEENLELNVTSEENVSEIILDEPASENITFVENNSEIIVEENSTILEEEIPEENETEVAEDNLTEQENSNSTAGEIVSQVLESVSNFFLGFLNPTGMVVSDYSSTEIHGETSADEPFSHEFNEDENIALLSGSVKTDSQDLPDNTLTIYFQGDTILVKTNYSEIVVINSSANETIQQINFNLAELNEEEKNILFLEFGNFSLEPAKYELFNGRYIVRYELGKYNIEYSYASDLSNETLEIQIEKDKTKWFKDIISKLSDS